ncbi:telomerase reverse transcriptase [Spea bombifrons]|uniref:telomerase reverse transcriptase n=1 Tax=Spea bombifrons TaxID=233779 RepID=UPI00234B7CF6|nr:telomerase reverse transcriptase [Spea bombifrons]
MEVLEILDTPQILKRIYNEVYGITTYVEMLRDDGGFKVAIIQEGDADTYRTFLAELVVCVQKGTRSLCAPLSFVQLSSQREVVARVIQRICEKKNNNVLAFGYGLVDESSTTQVMFAPNICSFFPNPTTATISTSILWQTLLGRIGDDVMMYLLETCSLFMLVPPGGCYQISGRPIYTLCNDVNQYPALVKERHSKSQNNVVLQFVQRKNFSSKKSYLMPNKWKRNTLNKVKNKTKKIQERSQFPKTDSSNPMLLQAAKHARSSKRLCNMSIFELPNMKRHKIFHNREPKDHVSFAKSTALGNGNFTSTVQNNLRLQLQEHENVKKKIIKAPDGNSSKRFEESNSKVVMTQNESFKKRRCSVTITPEKISLSRIFIDFGKMLYSSKISTEGLLKDFLLNSLESSMSGSHKLIRTIFLNSSTCEKRFDHLDMKRGDIKNLPKRYWQMRYVFKELLQNHKKCHYVTLLKKHCPVRFRNSGNAINTANENVEKMEQQKRDITNQLCLTSLLKQHSSGWQVYRFARECLLKIVPEVLWGSSHNKCCFLKSVKALIYSVKSNKISLAELMWKIRVKDCTWTHLTKNNALVPASEHVVREKILAKFFYWLMDTYVIQLLKSFYYITETMFQKNKIFFYRKSIWQKLQNIGLRNHFDQVKMRALTPEEVQHMQQQKNPNLISSLRFIPKTRGLRPISKFCCALGAQQSKQCSEKKIKRFNTQARNLFSVLNYEKSRTCNLVGASVFGLDDIHKKWRKFVLDMKDFKSDKETFYFVKADVKGAYDTIPHSKLKEIISKVIKANTEEVYCIRQYASVWMDTSGQLRKSFKRHVSTLVDFLPNMKQFVYRLQDNKIKQDAVLVEQRLSLNENSRKLMDFLEEIICNHILRINDKYYIQCCGIPQGSILSALLCSFFYGDMENSIFFTTQQDGVFLRLIDDFLFVTPHQEHAKSFLKILVEGIPQYGCCICPHKTAVNFQTDNRPEYSKVKVLPACSMFPWCGLLLDTQTLEVYSDYSSYVCTSIQSSVTFCHSATAGKNMREKLVQILRLKCHGLFLDFKVNCLRAVCINVYKIFLLQAYRFHACVLQLPCKQSIRSNPSYFLTVISDVAPCLYNSFISSNKDINLGLQEISGLFPFEAAQWLSCQAFSAKLTTHKTLYKCLLGPLKICKVQLSRRLSKEILDLLKAVTSKSLHKDFKTILD